MLLPGIISSQPPQMTLVFSDYDHRRVEKFTRLRIVYKEGVMLCSFLILNVGARRR